jgi:hypothetical protein
MKKNNLFVIALLTIVFTSCGPTQDHAIKYNDSIVSIIDGLNINQNLFMNQLDGHNIDSLKITHTLFVAKTKASLEDLTKVKPFEGKNELGSTATSLFTLLNNFTNGDAKQMVELLSKDSTMYTQQDDDKIQELAEKFDDEYGKAYDKLDKAQKEFSNEWKFDLIKDKE